MEAAPRRDRAVARRRVNQREAGGRAEDVAGGGETEGDEDAVDEGELPEVAHEPGGGHGEGEDQDASHRDGPRPQALGEPAEERHEDAIEQETQRDDEGVAGAIQPEVGDHGLEERSHREANAGGEEDHDGERPRHPPAVENARRAVHGANYSRRVGVRQRPGRYRKSCLSPFRRNPSAVVRKSRSERSVRGAS